jgi:hypothetical protein
MLEIPLAFITHLVLEGSFFLTPAGFIKIIDGKGALKCRDICS